MPIGLRGWDKLPRAQRRPCKVKFIAFREWANRPQLERAVLDWFGPRTLPYRFSQHRGALVDFGGGSEFVVKIKGSGARGQAISPTSASQSGPPYSEFVGPPYCVFDFEGKRMIDYAHGWDNAHCGGMSYTQAYREYVMADVLARAGYPVVPCVGYDMVELEDYRSWFSIHLWSKRLSTYEVHPDCDRVGSRLVTRLCLDHGIIGYAVVGYHQVDRKYYFYDLHPLQTTSQMSHSAISMTLSFAWALTIYRLGMINHWGVEKAREFTSEAYNELQMTFKPKDIEQFERWATIDVSGLSETGATTAKSWEPCYQHSIDKVYDDIQSNAIARRVYEWFCQSYPHFTAD